MHNATTQHTPDFPAERMTREEAAHYLGVSKTFLAQDATHRRHGVPFYKIGAKVVFYLRSELDNWLAAHKVADKVAA